MTIPTIPRETDITSSTYEGRDGFAVVRQAQRTLMHAQDRTYNKRRGARAAHIKRVLNAAMVNAIVTPRTPDMASVIVKHTDVVSAGETLHDKGYVVWKDSGDGHVTSPVVWKRLRFGGVVADDRIAVTLIAVKGA
jgi:hypothetical protein